MKIGPDGVSARHQRDLAPGATLGPRSPYLRNFGYHSQITRRATIPDATEPLEFWNVATRPAQRNGFGLSHDRAASEIAQLERLFQLATDIPAIYPEWRNLVRSVRVSGVQVHDARLAEVMRVHGLSHILTFNPTDFSRYPGIIPVHPASA